MHHTILSCRLKINAARNGNLSAKGDMMNEITWVRWKGKNFSLISNQHGASTKLRDALREKKIIHVHALLGECFSKFLFISVCNDFIILYLAVCIRKFGSWRSLLPRNMQLSALSHCYIPARLSVYRKT